MSTQSSQSYTFQANLFGALTLIQNNKVVHPTAMVGVRPLLAYLLLHQGQLQTRPALAGELWPDLPEKNARHALSQAIWRVKRYLPGLLQANVHTVGISPKAKLWNDVAEFEELLRPYLGTEQTADLSQAQANLRRTIQLYRGDLLEGFYEDWVLNERQRLRALYIRALEHTIKLDKLAGDHEQALAAAQTLGRVEPLLEANQREIMRLHNILNHPDGALEQFATYSQLLEDELGLRPESETLQLAREIAAGAGKTAPSYLPTQHKTTALLESDTPNILPLIGRKKERSELVAWLENTIRGNVSIGLLEGEAGIGKTRLLQEMGRDAEWRGIQVLWGKSRELEAANPYGTLLEALESGLSSLRISQITSIALHEHDTRPDEIIWLQVLYPLIPSLVSVLPEDKRAPLAQLDPAQERLRLAEALARLLLAWAHISPLVLVLEDLHWASYDTLDMLINLAEQLPVWTGDGIAQPGQFQNGDSVGILIIGSYRNEEAHATPGIWGRLQKLDQLGLLGRLTLQRLDATTTGDLVNSCLGTGKPAPLFEARLYAETHGNPLFLLETLRYLYDEGLLWRNEQGNWSTNLDESTADYSELPLSPIIEGMIAHRLAQLSPSLQQVVNAAAILGNRFDFPKLVAVSGLDAPALLPLLRTLFQRGFVGEAAQEYYFQHDKIRQVAYERLSQEERVQLHSRAAQVIEQAHPDQVSILAHHWTLGQVTDRAIVYHQLAAENAKAVAAYTTAVEHLNIAIELLKQVNRPEECFELLKMRESCLDVLGKWDAQVADLETMLKLSQGDPLRQVYVQCRQATLLKYVGRHNEAEAIARQALTLTEHCDNPSLQAMALRDLGNILCRIQPDQTISYYHQAIELYQDDADTAQKAEVYVALAYVLLYREQYSEAHIAAQTSLHLYEKIQDQRGQAHALCILGSVHSEQGDPNTAFLYYSRSLQIARQIGFRRVEATVLGNLSMEFWNTCQFAQALKSGVEAQNIFHSMGHQTNENFVHMNLVYMQQYLLGYNDTIWDELQHWLNSSVKLGEIDYYNHLATMGDIARCRGDFKTARAYLQTALTNTQEKSSDQWLIEGIYIYLAQLEIDEDNPATALKYLDAAESICRKSGSTSRITKILGLRSLTLLALGQPDEALKATNKAMAYLKPGAKQESYLTPFRHSQVMSALGYTEESHAALEQAYQILCNGLCGLPSEQQQMSWECIPEHRSILTAWQKIHPPLTTARLPRVGTPISRAPRDDEWVEVHWLVSAAEDNVITDKVARRHKRLLRLLQQAEEQGAAPTVTDLAMALEAAPATIKRDLAALRRAGHSISTRGNRGNK